MPKGAGCLLLYNETFWKQSLLACRRGHYRLLNITIGPEINCIQVLSYIEVSVYPDPGSYSHKYVQVLWRAQKSSLQLPPTASSIDCAIHETSWPSPSFHGSWPHSFGILQEHNVQNLDKKYLRLARSRLFLLQLCSQEQPADESGR